jgi:hypothetical protein
MATRIRIMRGLAAILVFVFMPGNKANGQTAESLSEVNKVFVGSLGTEEGATQLRDAMIKAFRKYGGVQIVATTSEADAEIIRSENIWVTGSMNVGPHGGFHKKPMMDIFGSNCWVRGTKRYGHAVKHLAVCRGTASFGTSQAIS